MTWAVAISVVSGVAARQGWRDAIGSALLLLLVGALWRALYGGHRMRDMNGSRLVLRRDHYIAEWIITSFAALFASDAARSLALEASAELDELVGQGASRKDVFRFARRYLQQMPRQLLWRIDLPAPPIIRVPRKPKHFRSFDPDLDDRVLRVREYLEELDAFVKYLGKERIPREKRAIFIVWGWLRLPLIWLFRRRRKRP